MTTHAVPSGVRAMFASLRTRAYARAAVGAGILIALVLVVGAEPFLRGLAAVSVPSAAAAAALGAAATVAAAWRWRILAGRLGVQLAWSEAIPAYYRSQFLNSVLVGGVLGDVHRALWHGRRVDGLAQASRAVAAERAAGQAVQFVLALVVLVSLQLWAYAPPVGIVLLVVVVAGVGLIAAAKLSARVRAVAVRELSQLRIAFGGAGTIARVTAASAIVITCLVAMFLVACVAVGVAASPERLVAVSLIAVLAGAIPFSVGGWGPREGAAAWAFAAAGLGATTGIAASTTFGVLALIAVAPGAVVMTASALRASALGRSAARGAGTSRVRKEPTPL
jgi:uncharacterized membrane protein YbhN (UPF0104 family)